MDKIKRICCVLVLFFIFEFPFSTKGYALDFVNLSQGQKLEVKFNERVMLKTNLKDSFILEDENGRKIPFGLFFIGDVNDGEKGAYSDFMIDPDEELENGKDYYLTINNDIQSSSGDKMSSPYQIKIHILANGQTVEPQPGEKGYSRFNPADLGDELNISWNEYGKGNYTANITLIDVIRGQEAWEMIKEANMFNDEPKSGFEYILAKVRFELVSSPSIDMQYDLSPIDFTAVSGLGKDYEYPSVVLPDPDIHASLYQGAVHEGWVAFQVAKDDDKPLLTFGRNYDGSGGIWIKLY